MRDDEKQPLCFTLRARDVVPYMHGMYCSIEDGKPFINDIVIKKLTSDGKIRFMFDTHNFMVCDPDELLEYIVDIWDWETHPERKTKIEADEKKFQEQLKRTIVDPPIHKEIYELKNALNKQQKICDEARFEFVRLLKDLQSKCPHPDIVDLTEVRGKHVDDGYGHWWRQPCFECKFCGLIAHNNNTLQSQREERK